MAWTLTGNIKGPEGDPGEEIVTRTSDGNPEIAEQSLRIGPTSYPSDIPYPESGYLIIDRDSLNYDASVVFRTLGDTTGEIGHTGDGKNVNFKVVDGTWGSETFQDSFKMIHPTGYVQVDKRLSIGFEEPQAALDVMGGTTVRPVALPYGATVSTDCSLSDNFRLIMTGDCTFGWPQNPVDGQKVMWEVYAEGRDCTVTLEPAAFKFGTTLTEITPTKSGTADFIGAVYSAWAQVWRVIAYAKGY